MASELTAERLSIIQSDCCHPHSIELLDHITALEQKIKALESDAQFHWKEVADMRAETIIELQERIVALERS